MLNQPSDKAQSKHFQRICNHLASTYVEIRRTFNGQAEKPIWQARFFVIHEGAAIFLDVLDSRTSTKPIRVVIHNRDWTSPVPEKTMNYFFKYLEKAETSFSIVRGVHFD